jgi:hypothetical protein
MGAWRILGELALLGTKILGKYVTAGVRDAVRVLTLQKLLSMANQASSTKRLLSSSPSGNAANGYGSRMPVEEAYKILSVDQTTPRERILDNYWRMFRANDQGSLYVQSKFVRARQCIEQDLRQRLEENVDKRPSSSS